MASSLDLQLGCHLARPVISPSVTCVLQRRPEAKRPVSSSSSLGRLQARAINNKVVRKSEESRSRRSLCVRAAADDGKKGGGGGGLFGFVTNNESSRNAVYMDELEDGDGGAILEAANVGDMIEKIGDKGQENGRRVEIGKLAWFVREHGDESSSQPPILLLHGVPSQSFSFRELLPQLADAGYRCISPDWIGYGFSNKPQPGYGFNYTETDFHKALDDLLAELAIKRPFTLLVQGFITSQYALTWALQHQEDVHRLIILNTPLLAETGLPLPLNQLKLPFVGEFAAQDALGPERFVEKGGPYVMKPEDSDIYRRPYLNSSDAGFAWLESVRKADTKAVGGKIEAGFTEKAGWKVPTLVAWGEADKYLKVADAEVFARRYPMCIRLEKIAGAGNQPQEDWPEKITKAVTGFLRSG